MRTLMPRPSESSGLPRSGSRLDGSGLRTGLEGPRQALPPKPFSGSFASCGLVSCGLSKGRTGRSRKDGACAMEGEEGGASKDLNGLASVAPFPGNRCGVEHGVAMRGEQNPMPGLPGVEMPGVRGLWPLAFLTGVLGPGELMLATDARLTGEDSALAPGPPPDRRAPESRTAATQLDHSYARRYCLTCWRVDGLRGLVGAFGTILGRTTSQPKRLCSSSPQPGRSKARSRTNGAWY